MTSTEDPFAAQRGPEINLFQAEQEDHNNNTAIDDLSSSPTIPSPTVGQDRRLSREWDASKVPPSQFQKRRGSLYAVPGSRDGHVDNHKTRDKPFHDKLKEKGWFSKTFSKN